MASLGLNLWQKAIEDKVFLASERRLSAGVGVCMSTGSMERTMRYGAGWTRTLAAAALVAVSAAGVSQQAPDQGPMAFAGGRMVRGTVTIAAADRLTIKTDAGEVFQVLVSPNTRLMKDRQQAVRLEPAAAADGPERQKRSSRNGGSVTTT